MKLRKRLAAGLLSAIMAVGATISAGALSLTEIAQSNFGGTDKSKPEGSGYCTFNGKPFYFSQSDAKKDLKTLTNPGVIENPGNPETEKSLLIPASELENYPVGTIIRVESDYSIYNGLYAEEPGRTEFNYSAFTFQGAGGFTRHFVLTEKMKKNGFLLTGYNENGIEEIPIENKPATISSVSFTAAIAKEYVYTPSADFDSLKKPITIDWAPGASASGLPLTESCKQIEGDTNAPATIPAEAFRDIPVGSAFVFSFNTTQRLSPVTVTNSCVSFTICVKDSSGNCNHATYHTSGYIHQYSSDLTDDSAPDATAEFNNRYGLPVSFMVTEDMKANGITFYMNQLQNDYVNYVTEGAFLEDFHFEVVNENSDIFSSSSTDDPVVKPGFSSAGSSIQDVPVNTVVTQKTAVSDGKYSERFVKKVAASDIEGKTKATFTLSNGLVTKTVSTTTYNTALTADGETISAGSGYVFLVYTLSGIPEGVTVTVGDVILE